MKLGFVSAILPDQSLEEVLRIASEVGYDCVEVMCWPPGKAERRYAGVTHIDITSLTADKIKEIRELCKTYNGEISGLGYYPNPLTPDPEARQTYISHIKALIRAAIRLDIPVVNTFIGRDQSKTIEDNWTDFMQVWTDIIGHADAFGIKVGIENCPMRFTKDEWPGGLNLFTTPAVWEKAWKQLPSPNFGLNYDPSHMIIQHMDTSLAIKEYAPRLHHVHAKDATIDKEEVNRYGIFAHPNLWHTPKLPGRGDVDWGDFFSALKSVNYTGAVCVEVEDGLRESHDYLRQFM